jgi:glycosyltransferase involved in cell wall biosynthesis
VVVAPSKDQVFEIMASSLPQSIHFFSGIHWVPSIVNGIAAAVATGRRFGLMSEPRAFEGVKGWARFAHSWLTEGQVRQHADFVLAIGRNGPPWFMSVGFRPEQIFPFAYFLPGIEAREEAVGAAVDKKITRVTFIGRITRQKGIQLLLDALPQVSNPIEVEVAGVGPAAERVRQMAASSKVPVVLRGAIPMEAVPKLLRQTDILVLPSINKDGWGAVVSEALMVGAAVVATDRVGASICLDDDTRGRIVNRLTGAAVAEAIDWLIDNGRLMPVYREQRAAWADAHLTGKAGAHYLLSILEHLYAGREYPPPFYSA